MESVFLEWGPPGAIILALGYVARALYARLNEVQDARIQDWKEQSRQLSENIAVLDAATKAQEARRA